MKRLTTWKKKMSLLKPRIFTIKLKRKENRWIEFFILFILYSKLILLSYEIEKLVTKRKEECNKLENEFNELIKELAEFHKENEGIYAECAEIKKWRIFLIIKFCFPNEKILKIESMKKS